MQGIGQLLASVLLLLPLLSVLAHNTDDSNPSHVSKRSTGDAAEGQSTWQGMDDVTAAKRFNEFVGKRAQGFLPAYKRFQIASKRNPYEFIGKRPNRFMAKRTASNFLSKTGKTLTKRSPQYEFVGKRLSPPSAHKRALIDFYGKRVQLPYEFVGKRIFGSAWERVSANTVEGDALIKDVTDVLNTRDTADHDSPALRKKRYSEWLGKRGAPIADQLLRDLVNKRISAMMRNRLQNGANPEFIGRREDDYPEDLDVSKRYTEFIGK